MGPPWSIWETGSLESARGADTGDGWATSHQDLGSCVWQAQPHQPSTHEHGRGEQDRDGFGDADQGAEN